MDCSPGSPVCGIFQARILEWVGISSPRGSSWPRDRTYVFCIGRQGLYQWATRGSAKCTEGMLKTEHEGEKLGWGVIWVIKIKGDRTCLVTKSCSDSLRPMDCSSPGLPVPHYLLEFAQVHVQWVGDGLMASPIQCGQESVKQVCVYICRSRRRQALFMWISYEAGAGGRRTLIFFLCIFRYYFTCYSK